ncbi:MAG: FGGY-family carbohydrate kinase [Treponema sp.]|jgi:xylulokinase|nr:FGGY-family carbohydrate kinase [Treponema sp.]
MDLFLGIDIGTSAGRGLITDITGKIIADYRVPHEISMPRPGWAEQDADKVWWNDFLEIVRVLLQTPGVAASDIRAVGISAIAPCVLPVDKTGNPLRPGILYGIDSRAGAEIRELEERVGVKALFSLSGQNLSAQSCCPKIRWIKNNEPEVYEKTACFLSAAGYLVYRLTGRFTLDIYNAMAYGPLYDIRRKSWDSTYEKEVTETSRLPELIWSTDTAGTVSARAAELTGLPRGTPVICGTADAMAEAVSVGLHRDGDMMMMYGSSNFFILRTDRFLPQEYSWASYFAVPGENNYVLAGGMTSAGNLFKWLRETFPGRSFSQWEELSAQSSPGAGGLALLPYFAGERTPVNNPHAKGALFGLTLRSKAGDVYRAFQEALAYGVRHNIETLREKGVEARRIFAIGGISQSRQLLQIISDVSRCPQLIAREKAGAPYGDAFLAALGTGFSGGISDISRWVRYEHTIEPGDGHRDLYDEGFERYKALYKALEPFMSKSTW